MLLGTIAAKLFGSALAGRGVTTATKKFRRRAELLIPPHHLINFEIKNIFKTNLHLMVFIKGIIYLKKRMVYIK